MSELEQDLRDYAAALAYPPTPLVWETVGVAARKRRRVALLAVALAVIACTVALAVPPARSGLARLLHLDGVAVVRLDRLPRVPRQGLAGLGARATLADAQNRVPFPLLGLANAHPATVLVGADRPRQVALVYGEPNRPRLIVTQFKPCCGQDTITKEVPDHSLVEAVTVRGVHGLWVAGPHVSKTGTSTRLAANALIWETSGGHLPDRGSYQPRAGA